MKNKYLFSCVLTLLLFSGVSLSKEFIPVEVFATLPQFRDVEISPDGTKLALFANLKNGYSAIYIQDLESNKGLMPLLSSDNKQMKLQSFSWFDNETLLADAWFSADFFRTKIDNTRLLYVKADGTKFDNGSAFQPVFRKEHFKKLARIPQFHNTVIDKLSDDPDHILVSIPINNDRYPDVVKVNVRSSAIDVVKRAKSDIRMWKTDKEGKVRIGFGFDRKASKNQQSVLYKDPDLDQWKTLWKFGLFDEKEVNVLGFGEDPKQVWISAYHEGKLAIFKVNIEDGKEVSRELVYSDPNRDVEGSLRYAGGSKDPIGVRHWDENGRLVTWDQEIAKFEKTVYDQFPDDHVYFISFSKDRKRFILYVVDNDKPGEFYLGDETEGGLDLIANTFPRLSGVDIPPREPVYFNARDGLEIEAYLTLPKGQNKNLPTVIFPHGGPIAADDDVRFDYWTSFFTSRGYAVLQPNFRGSSGYGLDFKKAGLQRWGLEMQTDIEDATRWMIDEGIADEDSICIVGGSYGGYAALMGAANSNLFKCAVSFAGVTDLSLLIKESWYYGTGKMTREMIGTERSKLIKTSPVNLANQINIPVLLVQGEDDSRVTLEHGTRMEAALRRAKADYIYIQQEDSDHFLSLAKNRLEFFRAMDLFLSEHL